VIIAAASLIPTVRNVEDLLPDHEQGPETVDLPAEQPAYGEQTAEELV
jgi:hypothetical protein